MHPRKPGPRRIFFLLLGGLVFLYPAAAQSGPITEIAVLGLNRTKPQVAEAPLRKFLGREGASLDLDEVRAAVIATEILEPVAVEVKGTVLTVRVEEKWSILPLPLFFMDSAGINAGVAFMDTNAFGLNDKLLLGGMYGSGGWLATGMYLYTPDRPGLPGWSIGGLYDVRERQDTDQRERIIRRFPLDSITAFAGLSYDPSELIGLSLTLTYNEKIIRDTAGELPAGVPKEGARTLNISPELSLGRSHWDGIFLSQENISLAYTFIAGIGSPSFHTLSLRGSWEKSLLPGFRLVFKAGGIFAPGVTAFFESAPSVAQVQIMPRFFSARHYAGSSLGLEKHLLKGTLGTLSVLGAYQFLYSQGPLLGDQADHGFAAALRFYMSKVALPALGLDFAYNLSAAYPLLSFSAGVSF
jgi:hypothetical protein